MRTQDPGYIFGPKFIPNCASVRIIWDLPNGKQANNILHGRYSSFTLIDQTSVNNLYTAITSALSTSGLAAALSGSTELSGVGVRNLADSGGGVGYGEIRSNLGAVAGSGGSNPLPPSVSFVVSLKTGKSGQANRGRVYLPGYDESTNQGVGVATDAAKNNSVDFIGHVKDAMNTAGLTLCIGHYPRAGYNSPATGRPVPARGAGTVDVVSILALNNVWDSTRLRSLR